jgi:hypothetical protein
MSADQKTQGNTDEGGEEGCDQGDPEREQNRAKDLTVQADDQVDGFFDPLPEVFHISFFFSALFRLYFGLLMASA